MHTYIIYKFNIQNANLYMYNIYNHYMSYHRNTPTQSQLPQSTVHNVNQLSTSWPLTRHTHTREKLE